MKAYLITHLVLYVAALVTTKRERAPYSDGLLAFAHLFHIAFIAWTIYMLCEVLP
jgi:hypothetical protein